MANKKISELTVATTPAGPELAEIVQGGVNKQTTLQDIANLVPPGGVTSVNGQTGAVTGLGEIANHIGQNNSATTSAQLAATITDETGTGFAVFSDSPTFTGTPVAPTAAGGTNTTQLATTAFVTAAVAASTNIIDQVSTSVAGGTITLDMNSQKQRSHVGSATFSAAKIVAMSNTTGSLFFNWIFEITSVSAVLTFPSDWLSSSPDFNGTTWTPPTTGRFQFGGSFDDINNLWYISVGGPFA